MKRSLRLLMTVAIAATACLSLAVPAHADARVVRDARGDASSSADLTRVVYANRSDHVVARARLRDLTSDGGFSLVAAVPQSDGGYIARVWRTTDGEVGTRLWSFSNTGMTPQPCADLAATWRRDADRVTVSIPRTCIDDMPNRLYLRASFRNAGERDDAPRAVLNRA